MSYRPGAHRGDSDAQALVAPSLGVAPPCYRPGTSFADEYAMALRRHLEQPGETGLHAAYDLGRRALADGMTLIEVVTVHHESRMALWREAPVQLTDADAFLREALGAYEIAELGFWEVQRQAALEHERVEVLGRLNEAHMAVMAVPGLAARLREVCDRALALVDGQRARLELRQPGRGRAQGTVVERGDRAAGNENGLVRVGVPARTGIGVLEVWPRPGASFGEADRAVLGQFALLASGAIDDALRLDRERSESVTLQQSLMPGALPELPGLNAAARYMASGRISQVGGDWYDLIDIGPSDERACLAIVGDVMGHGLREASLMAALRVAFHAYALADEPAATIVDRVDRLFSRLAPDHLATVVVCRLDLGAMALTVVNAGHPPPVQIQPDGRASLVKAGRSLPLGVRPDEARELSDVLRLESGTKLLLYTDGLTERIDRAGGDGDAALLAAVQGFRGSVQELCDHVLDAMIPSVRPSGDDTCVLALELTPTPR
jgi:serine phosphatase RsbU (regulator of sigma subunit)